MSLQIGRAHICIQLSPTHYNTFSVDDQLQNSTGILIRHDGHGCPECRTVALVAGDQGYEEGGG